MRFESKLWLFNEAMGKVRILQCMIWFKFEEDSYSLLCYYNQSFLQLLLPLLTVQECFLLDEYTADKTILDKLIAVTDVGFAAVYKSNRTNNDLDHDLDLFISHHRFFYFMTQLYYFNNKQRKVIWSLDFEN